MSATISRLALAAGLAAASPAALGQSFTGSGPVRAFTIPAAPASATVAPARTAAPILLPLRTTGPRLHHLPAHVDGLLLAGETVSRLWAMELTDSEAADPAATVQVGYRAAVSVSPESSTITVRVNDRVIGTAPIRAPSANRTLRFAVPRGLLNRGANAVRVSVEQRHRVDCSPEASFELWTRLEPGATGLLFDATPVIAGIAELPALWPDANGHVAVTILRGPGHLSVPATERAILGAQLLALAGRFTHVTASVALVGQRGRTGIELAVAPADALPPQIDRAALGSVDGPRAAVLPGSVDAPPVLVVTGRDDAEVDRALQALEDELRNRVPPGSEPGRRALANREGRAVFGGETLSLASLGLPPVAFAGRAFRLAFDLRLPADSLPADYDRVALRLAGGYEAGLQPGAQLRLEVNGGAAASLALGRAGGETFRQQEVLLPLGRLQPGRNVIAVTAALPHAADKVCAAPEPEASARFTLSDRTEFVLPAIARAARLPELSHLAAGAFPYGTPGGERPSLVVPSPDAASVGAAATLAVRLATAAGRPIRFAFRADRPSGRAPALVVAPARALDPDTLGRIGLNPETLKTAWKPHTGDPVTTGSIEGVRRAPSEVASCRNMVSEDDTGPAPPAAGAERYDRERSWFRRVGAWLAGAPGSGRAAFGTAEDLASTSLLVAQGVLPAAAGAGEASSGLVTVVSAPTPALLTRGVACLVHPQVWEQLGGRLSLVDGQTGTVRSVSSEDAAVVLTQPFSVGNTRRIVAGWLSLNPGLFTLLVLAVAGALALATHGLVGHVGRRNAT